MWAVEFSVCFLLRQLRTGTTGPSTQIMAAAREIAAVCGFQYLPGLNENQRIQDATLPRRPIKALSLGAGILSNVKLHLSCIWTDRNIVSNALRLFGSAAVTFSEREAQSKHLTVALCQVVWISTVIFLQSNNVLFLCVKMTVKTLFSAPNIYIAATMYNVGG